MNIDGELLSKHTPSKVDIGSWYPLIKEVLLFESVAIGRLSILQKTAPHPSTYTQH